MYLKSNNVNRYAKWVQIRLLTRLSMKLGDSMKLNLSAAEQGLEPQ